MPPAAATEWDRTGWTLLMIPTLAPDCAAARAARCPASPAPIIKTSCSGICTRLYNRRPLPCCAAPLGTERRLQPRQRQHPLHHPVAVDRHQPSPALDPLAAQDLLDRLLFVEEKGKLARPFRDLRDREGGAAGGDLVLEPLRPHRPDKAAVGVGDRKPPLGAALEVPFERLQERELAGHEQRLAVEQLPDGEPRKADRDVALGRRHRGALEEKEAEEEQEEAGRVAVDD